MSQSREKRLIRRASWGTRFVTNVRPLEEKYLTWCLGLLFFKEDIGFDVVKRLIGEKFLDMPRFRSTYDFEKKGFIEMEKEEVDLDYHLQVVKDEISLEEVTEEYMGNIFQSKEIDFKKPLWYIYYFPHLEDGRSVIFTNVSHVIGDGISLFAIMFDLMDKEDIIKEIKSEAKSKSKPKPKGELAIRRKRKVQHHYGPLNQGLIFMKGVIDAIFGAFALDSENPLFRSKDVRPSDKKSIALSEVIPLDKVKAIKNKFENATVNDILITILNCAIVEYLKEKGMSKTEISSKRIRGNFPINRRKLGQPILKNGSPNNDFGVAFMEFVTSYTSRVDLVHKVKKVLDTIKLSPFPIVQNQLGIVVSALLPEVANAHIFYNFTNQSTAMLSNVPGPQRAVSFGGYELDDLQFGVYATAGLYMGLSSYNNKVGCCICLDKNLGKAEDISKFWKAEFEKLYEETMAFDGIIKPEKSWYSYLEYL